MRLKNHVQIAVWRTFSPVLRSLEGKMLRDASQTLVEGMPVFVESGFVDQAKLTAQMVSALRLLAVYAPLRYARARRDLCNIYVNNAFGPELWRATRTCPLPAKLVREASLGWIASVIVHEATHARLGWRHGHGDDVSLAMERCCVRAQMAFLRRLPVAEDPQRDELLVYLSQATSKPWWTKPAMMLRHRQTLAELGAPEWVQYFFTGGVGIKTPKT